MKLELDSKNIAILGCGNMGRALLKGLIQGGADPRRISVTNKRPARSQALAAEFGVQVADSNRAAVEGADIVILAVKPQLMSKVLLELGDPMNEGPSPLFISVAAGITIDALEERLGSSPRVIRAMPNTPAIIDESATALAAGVHTTEEDVELATAIFDKVGLTVVVDETHLDAVTGLSGSGPAYVMLIIEAFADAGVKVGLSREVAMQLAVQTIRGSAKLQQETGAHPGVLKDQVTSPGGTAIAGLHTLEEGGLRTTIMNAVEAATQRAIELGKRR